MRLPYYPTSYNDYLRYYLEQSGSGPRNINTYKGVAIQRGNGIGSIFQNLFRFISPLVKSAGRTLLKRGLNVGHEVLAGKNIGEALKEQAGEAIQSMLGSTGSGRRKKYRRTAKATSGIPKRRKRRRKTSTTATKRKAPKRRKKTATVGTARRRKRKTTTTVKRRTSRKKRGTYLPQIRLDALRL